MPQKPVGELPGDVLIAFRKRSGFTGSPRPFARTLPVSPDTLRRLEMVKWGTCRDEWPRPVQRTDLDSLIVAGWMKKGDEWWQRFETAFAWQDAVMQYGRQVYEGKEPADKSYTPVLLEHVISLVRMRVSGELQYKAASGQPIPAEQLEATIDRVTGDILFRLAMRDLIVVEATGGPSTAAHERTRALEELFAAPGQVDTEDPYVSTLCMVYRWAGEIAEEAFGRTRAGE